MSEERAEYAGWRRNPGTIIAPEADPHVPGQRAPWGGRNVCKCVRRHVPSPLEVEIHHLVPMGRPYLGPDTADNRVPLCQIQHGNVHFVLRIFEKHGGKPPREAFRGISLTAALRRTVQPALQRMGWTWPDESTVRM